VGEGKPMDASLAAILDECGSAIQAAVSIAGGTLASSKAYSKHTANIGMYRKIIAACVKESKLDVTESNVTALLAARDEEPVVTRFINNCLAHPITESLYGNSIRMMVDNDGGSSVADFVGDDDGAPFGGAVA